MTDEFTLDDDTAFSIPDHVLSRNVSGETVLMSLAVEQYYGLDGVGSRMWELIESGTIFGDAVSTLSNEFDVDITRLTSDLRSLLEELCRNDLVRTRSCS